MGQSGHLELQSMRQNCQDAQRRGSLYACSCQSPYTAYAHAGALLPRYIEEAKKGGTKVEQARHSFFIDHPVPSASLPPLNLVPAVTFIKMSPVPSLTLTG